MQTPNTKSFFLDNWFQKAGTQAYAPNRGFVLVYSVLVGGILLSVGIGIFAITFKEIVLSRYGRESQVALAVADSGIECALYADLQLNNVFATSSESAGGTSVQCGGDDVPVTFLEPRTSDSATSTFATNLGNRCVFVAVGKHDGGATTIINSRGYNTGDAGDDCTGASDAATRVERGLRISY